MLSPEHSESFADLDDRAAALVMGAIRDRMEEHASHPVVRYTQAIVNHGREAGASLAHPHAQLLGMPFVPGAILEEEAGFGRFEGNCLLCATVEAELADGTRVVLDTDRVVVVCPYWSGTPYEMLVIPKQHDAHLTAAPEADLAARRARAPRRDALAASSGSATSPTTSSSTPRRSATTGSSTGTCTSGRSSSASPGSSGAPA